MRIGVDISDFRIPRAGIARYLSNMLRRMLDLAPYHSYFGYSAGPVDLEPALEPIHLRTAAGYEGRPTTLWLQRVLPRWLAEDRVDIFWGQNHLLPMNRHHRMSRVITLHDTVPAVCPRTMRLKTRLAAGLFLGQAARSADYVIAVSKATARLAVLLLGVSPARLEVIYEGVENSFRPVPGPVAARAVRQRFGLEPGYLLTVGTLEPRKKHGLLLDVHAGLPSAPQLVLAGSTGWRSDKLLGRIRDGEHAGRVRYLGRVDDECLPALYSAAMAMVFPSCYEGFGLPVLEAMACGCPVVCSWSSSLPEVGGDAVLYFRPGDIADLARQVSKVAGSAALREQMSARGLLKAGEFSFAQAAGQTLNLMERLVARKPGPDPRLGSGA